MADFFNTIGQKPPIGSGDFRPGSVIQNWLIGKSQTIESVYEIRGDSRRPIQMLNKSISAMPKATVETNAFGDIPNSFQLGLFMGFSFLI